MSFLRRIFFLVRMDFIPHHHFRSTNVGGCDTRLVYLLDLCESFILNLTRPSELFPAQLALFNYIIDTYTFIAASALASNTVFRSLAGAAFPLFATQMYNKLNPRWASSLLGFIALAMMPIPFVLTKYVSFLAALTEEDRTYW
jgi:hypothetical protein